MAIVYLWSGATGAANGTSWTDAYTTISAAVTGATPGTDIIYIHTGATGTHLETWASSQTINLGSGSSGQPQVIVGVDKNNSDAYTKSASKNFEVTGSGSNDLSTNNATACHGVWFEADDNLNLDAIDGNEAGYFADCHFKTTHSTNGDILFPSGGTARFINCTYDSAGGANLGNEVIGGSMTIADSTLGSPATFVRAIGLDLTGSAGADNFFASSSYNIAEFIGCKVNSGGPVLPTTYANVNSLFGVDAAAGDWFRQVWDNGIWGAISLDDAVYRDGGATYDGTNEYSHVLETNTANCMNVGPWNEVYVDATGSTTFTVEIANATGTLQDDDVALEICYFANTGDTLMKILTSWAGATTSIPYGDPTATPANITSSAETWTGIAETAQKLAITATVNKVGPVMWRVVSRTTTDVYYCPKISVA